MPEVERLATERTSRANVNAKCRLTDLKTAIRDKGLPDQTTAFATTRTMDWIDSTWADDSYWNDPDTYPTFDDDLAFIDSWHASIAATIDAASDLAGAQSDIAVLLSGTSLSDPLHAAWAAEAAALAVASASYWNENLDEWQDQFCNEEPPQDAASITTVDPCEEPLDRGLSRSALRDNSWDAVKGFALADVNGYVSIGVEIYNGYKNVRDNWAQVGRYINGASGLVRLSYPTTRQMVVMGAKSIGRYSIVGLVGTALLDSAVQSWQ